ncbi:hypothetical protein BEP19_11040 [Ammoniphilus oxalaticus]|uniref:4-amino-4-deoxychorismate lyase n=2 Tax=Ammoniphilus oxalaticus TaxID=66863 RepID=A0A419SG98_9BACL|nr:hypothetical protein BEP19_11040 [Ammoniphilus oxalaticus]
MKVFLNGRIVNEDQAVISVFDHGFLYGYGLFETIRAYRGRLFLFDRHYDRLVRAADAYNIKLAKTAYQLYDEVKLTLKENNLQDAYIRITLSGGTEGLGLWGGQHHTPTWLIMAKPLGDLPSVKGITSLNLRRASAEGAFRSKSLSFANNMLAKKELYERGLSAEEGVFFSERGYLVEGTVSNLFFARNGTLYTPHEATGLLPGVTRAFVIELAQRLNIELREGFYKLDHLMNADEIFLTNSIQEIVPVDQLDGNGVQVVGPLTERLILAYQSAIEEQGDVVYDKVDE